MCTCEACGFCHRDSEGDYMCRRYAPKPILTTDDEEVPLIAHASTYLSSTSAWPYVQSDDWCGEWHEREGSGALHQVAKRHGFKGTKEEFVKIITPTKGQQYAVF